MRTAPLALSLPWILLIFVLTAATLSNAMDDPESEQVSSSDLDATSWSPDSDDASSSNSNDPHWSSVSSSNRHRAGSSTFDLPALRPAVDPGTQLDYIPAYTDSAGIRWGPFPLHPSNFQLEYYRLNEPALAHLYQPDGSVPIRFEKPSGIPGTRLRWVPGVYRPEPEVLRQLRSKIIGTLRTTGWSGKEVHPSNSHFYEGMYLWPPLQRSLSGYKMPTDILEGRIITVPSSRLRRQVRAPPNLFEIKLDTPEGPRYILATSIVKNEMFTALSPRDIDSKLWLFYERRQVTVPRRVGKSTAFLGAMFLPKEAQRVLLESGGMTYFLPR